MMVMTMLMMMMMTMYGNSAPLLLQVPLAVLQPTFLGQVITMMMIAMMMLVMLMMIMMMVVMMVIILMMKNDGPCTRIEIGDLPVSDYFDDFGLDGCVEHYMVFLTMSVIFN